MELQRANSFIDSLGESLKQAHAETERAAKAYARRNAELKVVKEQLAAITAIIQGESPQQKEIEDR